MTDRQYKEDFDWAHHASDSVPFVAFVAILTITLGLVAVL